MLLGADTGLFVAYANDHPRALEIWQQLIEGQHALVVSTLTIHEILVYFFRRGEPQQGEEWVELLQDTEGIEVVSVSPEIAALSARYRHGLGLPAVDSIILATFLEQHCEKMVTTDEDFRVVETQKVMPVEFLT